jgi:sulfatase modifying factor 1
MISEIVGTIFKIVAALSLAALTCGCELFFVPQESREDAGDGGFALDAGGLVDAVDGNDAPLVDADATADVTTPPPSCAGLPASCGPDGGRDCCGALPIDGGTFKRSFDGVTFTDGAHQATVSAFTLDAFETTVGRFRNFVNGYSGDLPTAGSGRNPNFMADPGWDMTWNTNSMPGDKLALEMGLTGCDGTGTPTWTGSNQDAPINCVTWFEAFAFCIWDHGRLPTEAEWNFAAAGGDEQRVYPWSSPPSSTAIDNGHSVYTPSALAAVGSTSPAGDGKWGHADLAGNLIEWVIDWKQAAYLYPCNDCAEFTAGSERVNRGGGWDQGASSLYTSLRSSGDPHRRHADVGVRCAR